MPGTEDDPDEVRDPRRPPGVFPLRRKRGTAPMVYPRSRGSSWDW